MVSVAGAIGHLPAIGAGEHNPRIPNHRTRTLSDLNLKRLTSARPGQSNAYMEETEFGDLSLDCHRKVNERLKERCFSDVYTRMRPDFPSPTITTKCHSISNGRYGHYDERQVRGISLREAAILQSFPENYVFYPEDQIDPIARMIGSRNWRSFLQATWSIRLRGKAGDGAPFTKSVQQLSTSFIEAALPKYGDIPACGPKQSLVPPIALGVLIKLCVPKLGPRCWTTPARAIVAVPETPVNENRDAKSGQNDVGCAREITLM